MLKNDTLTGNLLFQNGNVDMPYKIGEKMDLNYNGYIVQRKNKNKYQGVEGDNWYLNYEGRANYYQSYYNEMIDLSWKDNKRVDCCADFDYVIKYGQESKELNIEYRVILCETEKSYPIVKPEYPTLFLGYDYAYTGGSYYSCVYNDLYERRVTEFEMMQLNKNGLFDTEEDIKKFINKRNDLKQKYNESRFEKGDFIIYRLSEVMI